MKLEMLNYPVRVLAWGQQTAYTEGRLTIDPDGLRAHLQAAGDLDDLNLTEIALIEPGTDTRVVNIHDICAARARLDPGAVDYPGVLGPIQSVGDGRTANLAGMAVLALSDRPSRYNKVLDMSGPGAALTDQARLFHLAIRAEPRDPNLSNVAFHIGLRRIGLRAGAYLARIAAATAAPQAHTYTLDPRPPGLPRVAYVCMVASHQMSEAGEPVLYGDDVSGLLPTVLHPNELLDGAVTAPVFRLGVDTYTFQNNPSVQTLYALHGRELDFAGVVVNAAHINPARRDRAVMMIVNQVKTVLGASLAVLTKVGGGVPESDLMLTIEALEKSGVRTAAVVFGHQGDGSIEDSNTAHSQAADAVASAGIYDDEVDLPAPATVVGGPLAGPFTNDPADRPRPSGGPLRLRTRDISGAICQLGSSRVGLVEL